MKTFDFLCCGLLLFLCTVSNSFHAQEFLQERVEIYSGLPDNQSNFSSRIGQLDGEGKLDLAASIAGLPVAASISIHLNNDEVEFAYNAPPVYSNNAPLSFFFFFLADLNSDGAQELITDFGYYTQSGGFDYTLRDYSSQGLLLYPLQVGNINDDNITDIIFRDANNLYVGINDGNGNFPDPLLINNDHDSSYLPEPVIADFTNDGLADIIVYPSYFTQEFFLYVQQVDGGFNPQVLPLSQEDLNGGLPARSTNNLEAADYDSDGDQDILFENDNGVYLLLNTGAGNFNGIDTLFTKNTLSKDQFSDLNQDGVIDVIRTTYTNNLVEIFLRDPTGDILETITITGGLYNLFTHPIFIDIDGDTDLDLIESRPGNDGNMALFLRQNNTINEPNSTQMLENLIAHRIFPNPGSGLFNIKIEDPSFSTGQLIITDNIGRVLQSTTIQAGDNQFDLTTFEYAGLLLYQLFDPHGQVIATGQLVKQ